MSPTSPSSPRRVPRRSAPSLAFRRSARVRSRECEPDETDEYGVEEEGDVARGRWVLPLPSLLARGASFPKRVDRAGVFREWLARGGGWEMNDERKKGEPEGARRMGDAFSLPLLRDVHLLAELLEVFGGERERMDLLGQMSMGPRQEGGRREMGTCLEPPSPVSSPRRKRARATEHETDDYGVSEGDEVKEDECLH